MNYEQEIEEINNAVSIKYTYEDDQERELAYGYQCLLTLAKKMQFELADNESAIDFAHETLCRDFHGLWIPCSERLPEKEGYYSVTVKHKGQIMSRTYEVYFRDGEWEGVVCDQEVIAWMLLPEPWSGEA